MAKSSYVKEKSLKEKVSKNELKRQPFLFITAGIFVLYGFIFCYLPLFGWIMAFQDFKIGAGVFGSKFVGLKSFKFIFKGFFDFSKKCEFRQVLRNTLCMGVINLVTSTIMAIVFAILLNEVKNKFAKKFVQTISYLPHFLSMIIVVAIVHDSFSTSGIVHQVFTTLHLCKEDYNFFLDKKAFWPIVAFTNLWKETGWNAIIYLSAITSIDPSLYEAAVMDGAGRWARIRHITLPGIKSTIMILTIMNIGNVLNAGFELQYLLGGTGVLSSVAETIDMYVLDWGISQCNYSVGAAAGIFKSLVSIVLSLLGNGLAKKFGEERLF